MNLVIPNSQFPIPNSQEFGILQVSTFEVIIMSLPATSLPDMSVGMPQVTVTEANQHFSDLIASTTSTKQRTLITQSDQCVAVLVPVEDLTLLQRLEDMLDYSEAIEALDEPGENISLDQLKKEVGIINGLHS
jgi:prevent-host-death family protein